MSPLISTPWSTPLILIGAVYPTVGALFEENLPPFGRAEEKDTIFQLTEAFIGTVLAVKVTVDPLER